MKPSTRALKNLAFVLLAICLFAFEVLPSEARAETKIVAAEGASYSVSSSLADNLKSFMDKKVNLTLNSGQVLVGTVKGVGDHLVHLEKIQGREYFDSLIRLDTIAAMEAQFREVKR